MPYFIVLGAFGFALLAESLALSVCAAVPALRRLLPSGLRVLVGSALGFVAANLVSLLIGVVPVLVAVVLRVDEDSPGAQVVGAFALLGLFIGPLIASPIGFLGGAWLALRRGLRNGFRGAPRAQPVPVRQ